MALLHPPVRALLRAAPAPAPCATRVHLPQRCAPCHARQQRTLARAGKDGPLGAWLDLASLVTSGAKVPSAQSDFAREIGSEIYVEIASWHLYLRDMKYEVGLANAIAECVAKNGGKISADDVKGILQKVAVKLGGGRTVVSLHDVMGNRCVDDLVDLAQRFAKEL